MVPDGGMTLVWHDKQFHASVAVLLVDRCASPGPSGFTGADNIGRHSLILGSGSGGSLGIRRNLKELASLYVIDDTRIRSRLVCRVGVCWQAQVANQILRGWRAVRLGLLCTLLFASIASAMADSGLVLFTSGPATVKPKAGKTAPISKGSELRPGDLITTGPSGHVQAKFDDGMYLSVSPNSDIRLDLYTGDAEGRVHGIHRRWIAGQRRHRKSAGS